jgi:hypothetical protein
MQVIESLLRLVHGDHIGISSVIQYGLQHKPDTGLVIHHKNGHLLISLFGGR